MVKDVRVIEVKKSAFESNDERAALLREELKKKGVFFKSHVISWFWKDNNFNKNYRAVKGGYKDRCHGSRY